jgi:pimeloyl-ACP methyl ester carboxylesterase
MKQHDLRIDVSGQTGLPGRLELAATVFWPERAQRIDPPLVVFGFPGGGYARGYFDIGWPGLPGYSQAEHHVRAGFVFVACDHLGVGGSSLPEPQALTFPVVTAANRALVDQVTARLEKGTLAPGLEPLRAAVRIGMGQSMGGAFLVLQQERYRSFDAIAVLGYSGIHTLLPAPAGEAAAAMTDDEKFRYGFHWDDVPGEFVQADLGSGFPVRQAGTPPWGSASVPGCAMSLLEPGCVAREAARIDVPVFVGVGERDVCPDPHAEPAAYRSARDVTLYVQPRAAHMHNFAGTRALLWERLAVWMLGVGAERWSVRRSRAG